jgi:hypothetical protein
VRAYCLGSALFLAGCAATGGWSKTGTDSATASGEYEDCRGAAASAVKTDADIDQDILATRHNDVQRAGGVRVETQTMQEHTRDRAAAIIAACMKAKGFAEPR